MDINEIIDRLYDEGEGELAAQLDGETGEVSTRIRLMLEKLEMLDLVEKFQSGC